MDFRAQFGNALGLMHRSAHLMGLFLPGHELPETRNKLEAFQLFAYADRELDFPSHRLESLPELARRALTLSNYRRIWALEGAAHYYASRAVSPAGMLADAALPECTMVPMHAGMGTAFAGEALKRLDSHPSEAILRGVMERFFERCRANSRAGWYENAIEPMGLAVRTLHPHLLYRVSDAIGAIDPDSQRLYWHGVGRSLYFVPMNFMTFAGSHERALRTAIAEAPTGEDRRNAVAGLVWAVTLVNIPQPEVLKNLLRATQSISMRDAVINGITSALLVWRHMVPEDREFAPAYTLRLPAAAPGARLWNDLVVAPAARALAGEDVRIAALFQYRDLTPEVRK